LDPFINVVLHGIDLIACNLSIYLIMDRTIIYIENESQGTTTNWEQDASPPSPRILLGIKEVGIVPKQLKLKAHLAIA
jgi:hypothetical protein